MRHNGFVAFILTHGRPDRVLTYEKLRKHGYTGKIYVVCDDEDKTLPEYRKRFGDVLVFSKSEIAKTFDEGDNFGDRRAIIYARNACFELARQIGATHFIELDDDYTYFKFRFDAQLRWHGADVQDLDAVFDMLLDYFNSAPMLTLAIGQGGDYIGGVAGLVFGLLVAAGEGDAGEGIVVFVVGVTAKFFFKRMVRDQIPGSGIRIGEAEGFAF